MLHWMNHYRASRWALYVVPALAIMLALSVGSAPVSAHAHIDQLNPADGAVLTKRPSEVSLTFTEPVEPRFSQFKVYPIADVDDPMQQRGMASKLVSDVLTARGDEAQRVDDGLMDPPTRPANRIRIQLKEGLEPGTYVVMWRVLSIDSHTTQGFSLFTYQPHDGVNE